MIKNKQKYLYYSTALTQPCVMCKACQLNVEVDNMGGAHHSRDLEERASLIKPNMKSTKIQSS